MQRNPDIPVRSFENLRVLFVANPAARNGQGAQAAAWLRGQVGRPGFPRSFDVVETVARGHAIELALASTGYDALIACGGDGLFHELLQGLMRLPRSDRPFFGVLPCGNGNDFARTVGMPFGDVPSAWQALSDARLAPYDIGACNGEFFLQTLSFGLDAAIALGTQERRVRTGHQGTRLFLEEGVDQLLHHRDVFHVAIEAQSSGSGVFAVRYEDVHLMAVQLGPTYGGGFAICPDAAPDDGLFDVCLCRATLGFARAASLFLLAKGGHHRGVSSHLAFFRAPALRISFDREPPVQIDGEPAHGTVFDVRVEEKALDVLVAGA